MPAGETENRNTGAGGTTGSDEIGKASGGESDGAGDETEGGADSEND